MKVLLLLALFNLFWKSSIGAVDLGAIVARATEEHAVSAKALTEGKRSTPFSRAMELRNSIYRRSLELLSEESNATDSDRELLAEMRMSNLQDPILSSVDNTCNPNSLPTCTISPFRTINGQCNNLNNPFWGAANIALRRYAGSTYNDQVRVPRGGTNPSRPLILSNPNFFQVTCSAAFPPNLPNARLVSSFIHTKDSRPDADVTHMLAQFGQFLDHDITLTPEPDLGNCCSGNTNSQCLPIAISSSDPFFGPQGRQCLEFSRSTAFCENLSTKREQMNGITSFIDASNVYGSDQTTANRLKLAGGNNQFDWRGMLQWANNPSPPFKMFLPLLPNSNNQNVFTAGDGRARENPGLTALHTLFLREHNRIANEVFVRRPFLSHSEIYEIARKILGAEMQNIVYGQYLELVLGPTAMQQLGLRIQKDANGNVIQSVYDQTVDPSIRNSFATAAYRFGHSMIVKNIISITSRSFVADSFQLSLNFFKDDKYVVNNGQGAEMLLYGMQNQPAETSDAFITDELTNFLFRGDGATFGSDLAARNIQRGRDHGIPGYNAWRAFCGLPQACSWNQRPAEFDSTVWNKFSQLYNHPNDIDLFSAGIAELPVSGGLTGPTFNCIKARQFDALKRGDRFFFTHAGTAPWNFNPAQISHLARRNLGDIICDNTELPETRLNVFDATSPWRPCSQRVPLNIDLFLG